MSQWKHPTCLTLDVRQRGKLCNFHHFTHLSDTSNHRCPTLQMSNNGRDTLRFSSLHSIYTKYSPCTSSIHGVHWVCLVCSMYTWCTVSILGVHWVYLVCSKYTWCTVSILGVQWVYLVYSQYTWYTLGILGVHWVYLVYIEHTWCTLSMLGV